MKHLSVGELEKSLKIYIGVFITGALIWIIGLACIFLLTGCSKDDCEQEAQQLYNDYQKALQYSGGNTAAVRELQLQYEQQKSKLKC